MAKVELRAQRGRAADRRLKQGWRVATRFEKRAATYRAKVITAAILLRP